MPIGISGSKELLFESYNRGNGTIKVSWEEEYIPQSNKSILTFKFKAKHTLYTGWTYFEGDLLADGSLFYAMPSFDGLSAGDLYPLNHWAADIRETNTFYDADFNRNYPYPDPNPVVVKVEIPHNPDGTKTVRIDFSDFGFWNPQRGIYWQVLGINDYVNIELTKIDVFTFSTESLLAGIAYGMMINGGFDSENTPSIVASGANLKENEFTQGIIIGNSLISF